MPGSRVDDIRIRGVDRQRLDFVNLRTARGADLSPCPAAVARLEYSLERTRKQNLRMRRRLRQGMYRLAREICRFLPAPPTVVADPQTAFGAIFPRAHIKGGRVGLVHYDTVQNEPIDRVQLRQPAPRHAFVPRFVEPAVGGAQIEMVGLPRNRGKCPRIAPVRAHDAPRPLGRRTRTKKYAQDYGKKQRRGFPPAQQSTNDSQPAHANRKLPRSLKG